MRGRRRAARRPRARAYAARRRARVPVLTDRAQPCADPTRVGWRSVRCRGPRSDRHLEPRRYPVSRSSQAPYDVDGRTVFITGAARGIGAATAERLHAKGANVALVGLEAERLHERAERAV